MDTKNENWPFIGNYQHKVDDKGRMSFPSKFRHNLNSDSLITVEWPDFLGKDKGLFFYLFEKDLLQKFLDQKGISLEDISDFTEEAVLDKQGRVSIRIKSILNQSVKLSGCGFYIKCSQ